MTLSITFHGDLPSLLYRRWRQPQPLHISLRRRTSLKDLVESFGLPHTEVGSLLLAGQPAPFSVLCPDRAELAVWPIEAPWQVTRASLLRPQPLPSLAFLVDVNVAKLVPLLRMVGFDTACAGKLDDGALANRAATEQRLLLSRDRGLLQRRQVEFGRLIRASEPEKQLLEIVHLLGLAERLAPFSRCLRCNGLLAKVDKAAIDKELQPLTRRYYHDFSQCLACDQLYWPGSHVEKMKSLLARLGLEVH